MRDTLMSGSKFKQGSDQQTDEWCLQITIKLEIEHAPSGRGRAQKNDKKNKKNRDALQPNSKKFAKSARNCRYPELELCLLVY